ncbi:MAG: hypothetical protein QN187_05885 [Armatimonadota bacterium]|nr:hypothetical protein [Armatimonadota bacterium]MDR7518552.1 hypothetical protein [Armatimonadota bacterium]MDR7549914.1 hypothetical protein [Armatimonadota bacterium]
MSTAWLVLSVTRPDAARTTVESLSRSLRPGPAQTQPPEAPAQLEWLGWQFFRLTSLAGKVIPFNLALNDPQALFRNRESPLSLENIEVAHLVLVTSGHADDQGMAVEIARKTGAQVVTGRCSW